MNADSRRFLHLVGSDLPPANPLRVPPDDALDVPPPVRRIVERRAMLAGPGLEQAYADACEAREAAQRDLAHEKEQSRALMCRYGADIARLEQELAQRPRLLTARALRWLRIGRALGLV